MESIQPTIVETQKVDTFPTFYCNQTRLAMSQWDVTIDIGQADFFKMTREEGSANLPVEFKARIVMSLQHAKAFALALMQNIQKYENDFGPLATQPKTMAEEQKKHK